MKHTKEELKEMLEFVIEDFAERGVDITTITFRQEEDGYTWKLAVVKDTAEENFTIFVSDYYDDLAEMFGNELYVALKQNGLL